MHSLKYLEYNTFYERTRIESLFTRVSPLVSKFLNVLHLNWKASYPISLFDLLHSIFEQTTIISHLYSNQNRFLDMVGPHKYYANSVLSIVMLEIWFTKLSLCSHKHKCRMTIWKMNWSWYTRNNWKMLRYRISKLQLGNLLGHVI